MASFHTPTPVPGVDAVTGGRGSQWLHAGLPGGGGGERCLLFWIASVSARHCVILSDLQRQVWAQGVFLPALEPPGHVL